MKKPERSPLGSALTKKVEEIRQPEQRYTAQPRLKKDRGKREGQTNMTFFMAISTHRALRELANMRGVSLQQLVAQFVDRGLSEAGEAPFKLRDDKE